LPEMGFARRAKFVEAGFAGRVCSGHRQL